MATKHIIRLPEGCVIQLQYFLPKIEGEEYPDKRWRGILVAQWKGDNIQVEHESAGLIGLVGQLAKKWSQACPNSKMRKKIARSTAVAEAGAEPHE